MTKKRAKRLCLEMWKHLRDHPEIEFKEDLPDELYEKISKAEAYCPLCEVCSGCKECPLGLVEPCEDYEQWQEAHTEKERGEAAGRIVEKVENWKV
ncbi:MAG: hypothetical protein GY853_01490 [PVC group bacterium]|nr:hypothetical protein [PVC group bacterium]